MCFSVVRFLTIFLCRLSRSQFLHLDLRFWLFSSLAPRVNGAVLPLPVLFLVRPPLVIPASGFCRRERSVARGASSFVSCCSRQRFSFRSRAAHARDFPFVLVLRSSRFPHLLEPDRSSYFCFSQRAARALIPVSRFAFLDMRACLESRRCFLGLLIVLLSV
jgi:hypothetical protein